VGRHHCYVPLWNKLSNVIGKHRAVGVAFLAQTAAYCLVFFLGKGDIYWYWLVGTLSGIAAIGASFLLRSITADIVDYDNWKSGQERTSLFFAVLSTTARIGPTLAIGIVLPVLTWMGFDPGTSEPTPEAIERFRMLFILFPLGLTLTAALLLFGFTLDQNLQQDIRRMIDERDRAEQLDPQNSNSVA
jgi:GPH family glycoside/pentoside/hexuronide:cation symporter